MEKSSFHLLFWELKNINSFETYKRLKLSHEKALLSP